MKAFRNVLKREHKQRVTLGNQLGYGSPEYYARLTTLAQMRGGKGFQQFSTKGEFGSKRGNARRELRKSVGLA